MEKPQGKPQTQANAAATRRISGSFAHENLPSPPPDPRESDAATNATCVFKFPPVRKDQLPSNLYGLLDYADCEQEFHRALKESIADDCKKMHRQSQPPGESSSHVTSVGGDQVAETCASCQQLYDECEQFMEPLQNRLNSSITAALAAYGAVEQLQRLYSLWDEYYSIERNWRKQRECLRYVNLLQSKVHNTSLPTQHPIRHHSSNNFPQQMGVATGSSVTPTAKQHMSDTEAEIQQSLSLLDSILANESGELLRHSDSKHQRERSKSVMGEEIAAMQRGDRDFKGSITRPHLMRRQSTYSEGKSSKVSKWTKVKAAFKWERANVPALTDGATKDLPNAIGLTPLNREEARYLRVPSAPCGGGSSADSILSSSSGHLLSETGTPGTISSASSMDDIEANCRDSMRRASTKSDIRSDSRQTDDGETSFPSPETATMPITVVTASTQTDGVRFDPYTGDNDQLRLARSDSSKSSPATFKSNSNKSLRRCMAMTDFEVLPEDNVAEIKRSTNRRTRPPPSPLNLTADDLNDLENFYSPKSLKSPKDGSQSLNRPKKIQSPGNSSVPSSPSRHSDFFAEFESEDLSSGDFSEPSTPNHLSSRKSFHQKQAEINQRYNILRSKLDTEFEAKRQEWNKIKANPNNCRAITLVSPKSEEHSPNPSLSPSVSAKLLEENLTPDFKKKLRKWRVKKQISVGATPIGQQISPSALSKEPMSPDTKTKIDWNLWKTGQLKLDGQGLAALPDQKDLPEEFQKKLEQWNKIKRGGPSSGGQDSLKRASKHAEGSKKSSDDDRVGGAEKEKRVEKPKPHDKDKLEKLAKLKAIVTDHPAKEIEVKTSAGVMKFEGISRKFTRKLYEWEKARGIGPESSTFALLHPGYCPIDVGRISKDAHINENSPTLSRSLSLDSISTSMPLPAISHQASSLSLNDVNELKEAADGVNSSDALADTAYKKFEEPEAVMVEVEDDIVETASPLVTAHTLVEQQTPIYKYEEVTCNDYCNTRSIQSFESSTNVAPLLSLLKRTDDVFAHLKQKAPEIFAYGEMRRCEETLSVIRNIYPYYSENLTKANVLNSISDVQSELSRLTDLSQKPPLDEACCQEIMLERDQECLDEIKGLAECLLLLKQNIHGGSNRYPKDIVPDINITSEDGHESSMYATCDTNSRDQLSTTLEATDELSASVLENDTETGSTLQRTLSNVNGGKKKLRLRKTGSRQNSKTESDSSDNDTHSVLETPRRVKRKSYRFKQRSLDEDCRIGRSEEPTEFVRGEEPAFLAKVKPMPAAIEESDTVSVSLTMSSRPSATQAETAVKMSPVFEVPDPSSCSVNQNANVFVKTKRKVFTTVQEPTATDGIAVIEKEIDSTEPEPEHEHEPNGDSTSTTEPSINKETLTTTESETPLSLQQMTAPSSESRPPLIVHKSLSLGDVPGVESASEPKTHYSSESVQEKVLLMRGREVRPPLAADSFRSVSKMHSPVQRDASKRMEHHFKKNVDSPYSTFKKSSSGTIKKIETKICKINSVSSIENQSNEKALSLLERNSLTPSVTETDVEHFDYPTPTNSEPTSPTCEEVNQPPQTPISERAQRLLKAKQEFLQATMPRSKLSVRRRDEIVRDETWEQQYRHSDHSLNVETPTATVSTDDNGLSKSVSVDVFRAETPTQSDVGTDHENAHYDSLPRTVSRSAKISSKLGFATLASKFRRGGKDKKTPKGVSALCRQTLFADIITGPQIPPTDGKSKSGDRVQKSQSTPQAAATAGATSASSRVKNEIDRLNKSQSEQYVKRQKESYV